MMSLSSPMSPQTDAASGGAAAGGPCGCRRCLREARARDTDALVPVGGVMHLFPLGPGSSMATMVVCPSCGNKRCSQASDHRHACAGSNAPGQLGSEY